MDEDQELRFVCKLCFKKFPCGKSLGGHMRSHVVANSAESDEKLDLNLKKFPSFVVVGVGGVGGGGGGDSMNDSRIGELGNGQSSYGLRENPRKSWRAVNSSFPLAQEKICKQCGKGFQSLKALCGHMACHSEKDRGGLKDDHSWTSENHKVVMDSHSETEEEDEEEDEEEEDEDEGEEEEDEEDRAVIRTRSSKSKRFKKVVVNSHFPLAASNNNNGGGGGGGSSSASEIDGEEQEEVAMCLMMLSRDNKGGGVNSVVESSDNNSVILETKSSSIDMKNWRKGGAVKSIRDQDEAPQIKKIGGDDDGGDKSSKLDCDSDSGYFLDECAKAESDVSVDGFRRHNNKNNGVDEYDEFRERLKKRSSKSYRELVAKRNEYDGDDGDHHHHSRKRRYVSEKNIDLYKDYERIKAPPEKRLKYECFNCKKSFKSYQALGGHRPCHKKSSNTLYESRYESGENSLDDPTTEFAARGKQQQQLVADKKMKAKKSKGHVCPFCNRVFKNGQALGGHKRSHFIGGHDHLNNTTTTTSPATKLDLLDLNLPAPHDDEDDGSHQYSPW